MRRVNPSCQCDPHISQFEPKVEVFQMLRLQTLTHRRACSNREYTPFLKCDTDQLLPKRGHIPTDAVCSKLHHIGMPLVTSTPFQPVQIRLETAPLSRINDIFAFCTRPSFLMSKSKGRRTPLAKTYAVSRYEPVRPAVSNTRRNDPMVRRAQKYKVAQANLTSCGNMQSGSPCGTTGRGECVHIGTSRTGACAEAGRNMMIKRISIYCYCYRSFSFVQS
jgi:hypothetical protein